MRAYVAGDAAAFRALFDRYGQMVWRALRRGGLSDDVARDMTQQTFLQLHRARRDYSPDRRLRPWLMTIAHNVRRDWLRWRGRRPEVPIEPEQHTGASRDPGGGLDASRQAQHVREAVAKLSPKLREVIELHWFMELPFPEVAQALGISTSAAKVRAHRAYKKLRPLLEHAARAE